MKIILLAALLFCRLANAATGTIVTTPLEAKKLTHVEIRGAAAQDLFDFFARRWPVTEGIEGQYVATPSGLGCLRETKNDPHTGQNTVIYSCGLRLNLDGGIGESKPAGIGVSN